jgi:hypothetical protein
MKAIIIISLRVFWGSDLGDRKMLETELESSVWKPRNLPRSPASSDLQDLTSCGVENVLYVYMQEKMLNIGCCRQGRQVEVTR